MVSEYAPSSLLPFYFPPILCCAFLSQWYSDFFEFLPPGTFLLVEGWFRIAGPSFFAARILATLTIAGIACLVPKATLVPGDNVVQNKTLIIRLPLVEHTGNHVQMLQRRGAHDYGMVVRHDAEEKKEVYSTLHICIRANIFVSLPKQGLPQFGRPNS